jgi:hypothetical protein
MIARYLGDAEGFTDAAGKPATGRIYRLEPPVTLSEYEVAHLRRPTQTYVVVHEGTPEDYGGMSTWVHPCDARGRITIRLTLARVKDEADAHKALALMGYSSVTTQLTFG